MFCARAVFTQTTRTARTHIQHLTRTTHVPFPLVRAFSQQPEKDKASGEEAPPDSQKLPQDVSPQAILSFFQKFSEETIAKINLKEPIEGINEKIGSAVFEHSGARQIVTLLSTYLALHRGHEMSEDDLDERLSKTLPRQIVELVKEELRNSPADPVTAKLDRLEKSLDRIEKLLQSRPR
eukprot:GEMP01038495.1.p1 GENE.GEMP01038495.1~~GEMP01038495.1.p1  ORF type:complete len:180 (+),score=34.08 GEMP01038495.1:202-741(+)